MRQPVVETERGATSDDVRFRELKKRSKNAKGPALDAGPRGQQRHAFECLEILGPAVGIAGVVERVHADGDGLSPQSLGPGERER